MPVRIPQKEGKEVKQLKNIFLLAVFTASPLLMIAGVMVAVYRFPDIHWFAYALFLPGFLLFLANKKLEKVYNRNKQELEYDESGRRRGMEDYSAMSKRERIEVDKQKLAAMERIVSSTALKRMAKPGSTDPDKDMERLVGMTGAKERMRAMAARMEYDREAARQGRGNRKKAGKGAAGEPESRHMLFIGSPGTGKTTAARIMTGFLYRYGFIRENKCLETDGNFLKASTAADTAAKTGLILREASGGVLFIDEAYALAMDVAGKAAVATLMKRMEDDRGKVVIILAGYTDEMRKLIASNPGFAPRFQNCIEFPDYTEQEMCEIFRLMANDKGVCLSAGAMERFGIRIAAEKKLPYFGNARTVRKVVEEAMDLHALHMVDGTLSASERFFLTADDIPSVPDKGVFREFRI